MYRTSIFAVFFSACLLLLSACGGSDNNNDSSASAKDADGDSVLDADDNCVNDANSNQQDSDVDGAGDACDPMPSVYAYTDSSGNSTVSYSGQTKRHILISDLVDAMNGLTEGGLPSVDAVIASLDFYFDFDGTGEALTSSLELDGETIIVNSVDTPASTFTYGQVASGKSLSGKIAGNDSVDHLLGGEFFGWQTGLDADPTPEELVDYFFGLLGAEATDGTAPAVPTTADPSGATTRLEADNVTVTATGLDLRQLVQKFLLGAVAFSQGTADYLSIDFGSAANLTINAPNTYTEGAHDFDEAFGYFGAVRDYGDYSDNEIRGAGGRPDYANGYHDANDDGAIDLRSEFNFGNATNCAKRDAGSAANANPTDLTAEAFTAFLTGRQILQNAADAGELTTAAAAALDEQIVIAAQTWEKCVAATVVHYINDVRKNLDSTAAAHGEGVVDTDNDVFNNVAGFKSLAKHWAEMKGFALGLQFSPYSPFRSAGSAVDVDDLKSLLDLMGDAPVLADGTQAGAAPTGTAAEARSAYQADLLAARDILQAAYNFDGDNVANW